MLLWNLPMFPIGRLGLSTSTILTGVNIAIYYILWHSPCASKKEYNRHSIRNIESPQHMTELKCWDFQLWLNSRCKNADTSLRKQVRDVDPPSPAWKAGILAVVRHLRITGNCPVTSKRKEKISMKKLTMYSNDIIRNFRSGSCLHQPPQTFLEVYNEFLSRNLSRNQREGNDPSRQILFANRVIICIS